jgi:DNA repair photolyase
LRVIYKPKGRAGEYAKLALNIYSGCEYGCKYCYVPKILRRNKVDFHTNVKVRDNILSLAEEDAYKLSILSQT